MIGAFMLHALVVGALCAAAAWAVEKGLAQLAVPRRFAWIGGMAAAVITPVLAFSGPGESPAAEAVAVTPAVNHAIPRYILASIELPAVPVYESLDFALACGWVGLSVTVLAIYAVTSLRLARRARTWLPAAAHDVVLAHDIGPAVFGLLRPRVVLPRWLETASDSTRRLVLEHERQHIAARDPLILALALLLAALLPWNLPLLWQLRRLRFALELDCDARVLTTQADPLEYGEAMLLVNQRNASAPAGAIALIERPSQLERRIRIMTAGTHRFRKSLALAAAAVGAVCLFAATSITAPALAALDVPLKPTPSGGTALRLGQHFERMLADRFPKLLGEDHERMPMVVVLLNDDWSIARAAQVTSRDEIRVDEGTFGVLGMAREEVAYVGNMGMQSPDNPKHVVLIVYTERKTPGVRFVSRVFPDTRAVDRQIFRRYFPQAASAAVPAGQQVWVLLDREGHVIRSGLDAVEPSTWNQALEGRFPGIRTQDMITVTPITDEAGEPIFDAAGQELQLHSVWLAPDSPPPAS